MKYPRPYKCKPRDPASVRNIVIHESVTTTYRACKAALNKKDCGVHVAVGEAGQVVWEHPAGDRLIHTPQWNTSSVGVELVSPYYPKYVKSWHRWTETIHAPWCDKGEYVVPLPEQLEALWDVLQTLLSGWEGVQVPAIWQGLETDGVTYHFKAVPGAKPENHGVWAHYQTGTGHADGSFPVLYCLLRRRGWDAPTAYRDAVSFAKGSKGIVKLPFSREGMV